MKEYSLINKIKEVVDDQMDIIGDDVAYIKDSGTVITCDTIVEDVHFRLNTASAYDIGYKAGAVNLSDIAASGGKCKYFLVSLALPKNIDENFVINFYSGLKDISDKFETDIIGGDLTTSEKIVISITAIGHSKIHSSRKHALSDQVIIVSGHFGGSFTGLQLLENTDIDKNCKNLNIENKEIDSIKKIHLRPLPKIKEAQMLLEKIKYDKVCMMDTSDGLADALYQIAKRSDKRLIVEVSKIPVLKSVEKISRLLNYSKDYIALFGGEDFELISTCFEKDIINSPEIKNNFSIIGRVTAAKPGVTLLYSEKQIELTESLLDERISFKHF